MSRIYVNHREEATSDALADTIRARTGAITVSPQQGERVRLNRLANHTRHPDNPL